MEEKDESGRTTVQNGHAHTANEEKDAEGAEPAGNEEEGKDEEEQVTNLNNLSDDEFLETLSEDVRAQAEKQASKNVKTSEKEKKQKYRTLASQFKAKEPEALAKAALELEVDDDFFQNGGGAGQYLKLLLHKDENVVQAALTAVLRQLVSEEEDKHTVAFDDGLEGTSQALQICNIVDAIATLRAAEEGTKWNGTEIFVRHFFSSRPVISVLALRCYRILLNSIVTGLPVYSSIRWKWLSVLLTAGDPITKLLQVTAAGVASEKSSAWNAWASQMWQHEFKGQSFSPMSFSAKELKQMDCPCVVPMPPEAVMEATKCIYLAVTEVFSPLRQPEERFVPADTSEWSTEELLNRTSAPPNVNGSDMETAVIDILNSNGEHTEDVAPFTLASEETTSQLTPEQLRSQQARAERSNFLGSSKNVYGTTRLDPIILGEKSAASLFSELVPWHPLRQAMIAALSQDIRINLNTGPLQRNGVIAKMKYYAEPSGGLTQSFSTWRFNGLELLTMLSGYRILPPLHGVAALATSKDHSWCMRESNEAYTENLGAHPLLPVAKSKMSEALKEVSTTKSDSFLENIALVEHKRCVNIQTGIQCLGWKILDCLSLHEQNLPALYGAGVWRMLSSSIERFKEQLLRVCLELQRVYVGEQLQSTHEDESMQSETGEGSAENEANESTDLSALDKAVDVLTRRKLNSADLRVELSDIVLEVPKKPKFSRSWQLVESLISGMISMLDTSYHLSHYSSTAPLQSVIQETQPAERAEPEPIESAVWDDSVKPETSEEDRASSAGSGKKGKSRGSSSKKNKRRESGSGITEETSTINATAASSHGKYWDFLFSCPPCEPEELEYALLRLSCHITGVPFHELFSPLLRVSLGTLRGIFRAVEDEPSADSRRAIAAGECKVLCSLLRLLRNPLVDRQLRDSAECTFYSIILDKKQSMGSEHRSTNPPYRFPRELWKQIKSTTHSDVYEKMLQFLPDDGKEEDTQSLGDLLGDSILYQGLRRRTPSEDYNSCTSLLGRVADSPQWCLRDDTETWLSLREVISILCLWQQDPAFEFLGGGFERYRKNGLLSSSGSEGGEQRELGAKMCALLKQASKELGSEEGWGDQSEEDPLMQWSLMLPGSENLLASLSFTGTEEELGSDVTDAREIYLDNVATFTSIMFGCDVAQKTGAVYNPLPLWGCFIMRSALTESNDVISSFQESPEENHDLFFSSDSEDTGLYLYQGWSSMYSELTDCASHATTSKVIAERVATPSVALATNADKGKKGKDSKAQAKKGKSDKSTLELLSSLSRLFQSGITNETLRWDSLHRVTRLIDRLSAPVESSSPQPEFLGSSHIGGLVGRYGITGLLCQAPVRYVKGHTECHEEAVSGSQLDMLTVYSLRSLQKLLLASPVEAAVVGSLGASVVDCLVVLAAPPEGTQGPWEDSPPDSLWNPTCSEDISPLQVSLEDVVIGVNPDMPALDGECSKTDLRTEAMATLSCICNAENLWRYQLPQQITFLGEQEATDWETLLSELSTSNAEEGGKGDKKASKKGEKGRGSDSSSKRDAFSWSPGHRAGLHVAKHLLYLLATYSDNNTVQAMGDRWSETLLATLSSMLQVHGCLTASLNWLTSSLSVRWLDQVTKLCEEATDLASSLIPATEKTDEGSSKWESRLSLLASGFESLEGLENEERLLEEAHKKAHSWKTAVEQLVESVCGVLLPSQLSDFLPAGTHPLKSFDCPSFDLDTSSTPLAPAEFSAAVRSLTGANSAPSKKGEDKKKPSSAEDESGVPEIPEQQLASCLGLNFRSWFGTDSQHMSTSPQRDLWWVFGKNLDPFETDVWKSSYETIKELINLDIATRRQDCLSTAGSHPSVNSKQHQSKKGSSIPKEPDAPEEDECSKLYGRVVTEICDSVEILQYVLQILDATTSPTSLEHYINQDANQLKQHKSDEVSSLITDLGKGTSDIEQAWREYLAEHPSLPEFVTDSIFSLFAGGSGAKTGSKEKKKGSPRSKDKDSKGDTSSRSSSRNTYAFARAPSWRSCSPLVFPNTVSLPWNKEFIHDAFRYVALPDKEQLMTNCWSQDHLRLPRSCGESKGCANSDVSSPVFEGLLKRELSVLSFAHVLEGSRCSLLSDIIRTVFYGPLAGCPSSLANPLSVTPLRTDGDVLKLYTHPLRQTFMCASSIMRGFTANEEKRLVQQPRITNMFCSEAIRSGSLHNILTWLDDFIMASKENKAELTSLEACEVDELFRILYYIVRRPLFLSGSGGTGQSWFAQWSLLLNGAYPCARHVYASSNDSCQTRLSLHVPSMPLLHVVSSLNSTIPCKWILGHSFLSKGNLMYEQGAELLNKKFQMSVEDTCTADTLLNPPGVNPFRLDLDCQDELGRTPAMISFVHGHPSLGFSMLFAGCNPNAQSDAGDSLLKYALCCPSRSAVDNLVAQMEFTEEFLCSPFPSYSILDAPRAYLETDASYSDCWELKSHPEQTDETMEEAGTRLIEAGEESFVSFAVLLAYGASPTQGDSNGNHSFHWLASQCFLSCNWKSVEVVVSAQLSIDTRLKLLDILVAMCGTKSVDKSNFLGETPLHCALADGNVSLAGRLLDLGAYPNMVDGHGNLPLHYAALGRDRESGVNDVNRSAISNMLSRLLDEGDNCPVRLGKYPDTTDEISQTSLEGKISNSIKYHSYPSSLHKLKRTCKELLWYDNAFGVAPMQVLAGIGIAGYQFHRLGLGIVSQGAVTIPNIPCDIRVTCSYEKRRLTNFVLERCSGAWDTAHSWSCSPVPTMAGNVDDDYKAIQCSAVSIFKHLGCTTTSDGIRNTYAVTAAAESLRRQCALAYALTHFAVPSSKLVHACISSWCDINDYLPIHTSEDEMEDENTSETKNPYVAERACLHRSIGEENEAELCATVRPVYPECDEGTLSYHRRLLQRAEHRITSAEKRTNSTESHDKSDEAASMWRRSKQLTLDVLLQHSTCDILSNCFSYVIKSPSDEGERSNRISLLPLSIGILVSTDESFGRTGPLSLEDPCWHLLSKDRNCIMAYSYDQEDQLFPANVSDPYGYMISPVPVEVTYPTPLQLTAFCGSSQELLAFILRQQLCLEDSVSIACYNSRSILLDNFSRGTVEIFSNDGPDEEFEEADNPPTVSKAFVRAELQRVENDIESAEIATIPWPDPRWDDKMPISVKTWRFFNQSPQSIDNLQDVARVNGFDQQVSFYESLPPLHAANQELS